MYSCLISFVFFKSLNKLYIDLELYINGFYITDYIHISYKQIQWRLYIVFEYMTTHLISIFQGEKINQKNKRITFSDKYDFTPKGNL